jgi:hypothetical protein
MIDIKRQNKAPSYPNGSTSLFPSTPNSKTRAKETL